MIKSGTSGCIGDNSVVYTTKMERYATSMSYMNELGESTRRINEGNV